MQESDLSRREFLSQGISAGFALAVTPISLWAITTPKDGLVLDTVSIPTSEGKMPAYVARPQGRALFPTVLVIQEIFGIHEYIQDVCRRLAKQGYCAVAPSLYFRKGDVTKMSDVQEILSKVVSQMDSKQVYQDIDSTVNWLKKSGYADTSKLAITGFCWGGNVVWMYCDHNPKVKAGVAWYGKLVAPEGQETKPFPVNIASSLKVPVLGLYGGKDEGIPVESVKKMQEALKGKKSEIILYPEAGHGFHADYRPSYHEPSAKEGWDKMLAWFKKNGV